MKERPGVALRGTADSTGEGLFVLTRLPGAGSADKIVVMPVTSFQMLPRITNVRNGFSFGEIRAMQDMWIG